MKTENKKEIKEKNKKLLGASKYAGSKKKKAKKIISKDVKIAKKNSALKVKIKNLQKEIKRIESSPNPDLKEKDKLEKKLSKLTKINDKVKPIKASRKKPSEIN